MCVHILTVIILIHCILWARYYAFPQEIYVGIDAEYAFVRLLGRTFLAN